MHLQVNRRGFKNVLISSPDTTRFQTLITLMELMTVCQDYNVYNFIRYLIAFYYIVILRSCEHLSMTGIDLESLKETNIASNKVIVRYF